MGIQAAGVGHDIDPLTTEQTVLRSGDSLSIHHGAPATEADKTTDLGLQPGCEALDPCKPIGKFIRFDLIGPSSGPAYQIRHTQTMFQQGVPRVPVDTNQPRFKRCGPKPIAWAAVTDPMIRGIGTGVQSDNQQPHTPCDSIWQALNTLCRDSESRSACSKRPHGGESRTDDKI